MTNDRTPSWEDVLAELQNPFGPMLPGEQAALDALHRWVLDTDPGPVLPCDRYLYLVKPESTT